MRFGIFALIVSFGATTSWLNLVPGSTTHWIVSGAGAAVLVYLRHRVRRRGLKGLWRWGPRAGLDEMEHYLGTDKGEPDYVPSSSRSRRPHGIGASWERGHLARADG